MTNQELTYWVTLALISKGMRARRKNEIYVNAFKHTPQLSIIDLFEANDLWSELGLSEDEQVCLLDAREQLVGNAFLVETLLAQDYGILPIHSEGYPTSLKESLGTDAPTVLYTRGDIALLQEPSASIVGSRSADAISLDFTQNIARKAVHEGRVVVSGMAKGVDLKALDSALQAGGKSIVVLPQGIMTASSSYKKYYRELVEGRLLFISQFSPNISWNTAFAMMRNKVIYGLSSQVFIAQTDQKGGTWSGAKEGLKRKTGKIFVRWPERAEQNANRELVDLGATPVDMQGIPIATNANNTESLEEQIRILLKHSPLGRTLGEIRSCIIDERTDTQFRKLLEGMPDVEKTSKKSRVLYKLIGVNFQDLFSSLE